jgi:hypothetical protein
MAGAKSTGRFLWGSALRLRAQEGQYGRRKRGRFFMWARPLARAQDAMKPGNDLIVAGLVYLRVCESASRRRQGGRRVELEPGHAILIDTDHSSTRLFGRLDGIKVAR